MAKCERCGEKIPKGGTRCADKAACGVRWALADAVTKPGLTFGKGGINGARAAYKKAPKMGDAS
jgi:hypothetical protein